MTRLELLESPSIPADFGFSADHDLARQEARRYLTERCPMSEVRRLASDPVGFDAVVWKELASMGWLGLSARTDVGGLGLDTLHLALLFDEMGRALLPSPFFSTALVLDVVERAGNDDQRRRFCAPIIRGETIGAIALTEPNGSWEPKDTMTSATPVADGFVLDGVKTHVLFGGSASLLVTPCRDPDGELGLYVVELPVRGARVEPEVMVDSTRRSARITLEHVTVACDARLEGAAMPALTQTSVLGYGLLAAEMVGGIEAVLGLTRDYAVSRIQFGRPIGAFQAVKHPIVDMMVGCELARSLAYGAAAVANRDQEKAEIFARMAKAHASDVFAFAVKKGVQLHGGFGFTWDCDVHFYFKRALWSRSTLGDAVHHRRHLADALFSAPV